MLKNQKKYQVISNKKICPQFFRLRLDAPSLLSQIQPGQFIHLRMSEGLKPFFRRPFSVFRAKESLDLLCEVVGPGTKLLSLKKKGDWLDCVGPLGTPFKLPGPKIQQVVMVAGGIGVAPFLCLTDQLKDKGFELLLLYGGRTKDHVFSFKEFKENGCKVYISTDDGQRGVRGRVSELFSKMQLSPKTFVYTCGPRPMIESVRQFTVMHQLQGQASLEEVMACGVGTCLGCSIKTRLGYKTVCHDGPVFDLNDL
jgi:dihydroorotate dehydrogenase electron transfer subunit